MARASSGPVTKAPSSLAAVLGVSVPPVAGRFSYQISGAYPVPASVMVVDRDHSAPPAPGAYSICYINAYQAQPEELDWWKAKHPSLLLRDRAGAVVVDTEWNEVLFDISTAPKRVELATVVGAWIDGCAARGYHAVEADNLDSYTRSKRHLSAGDALAFGAELVQRAHRDHLALGQKNAPDLANRARQVGFDFAIAEECQLYTECDSYTAAYPKHLIEIEYTDQPISAFAAACALRAHQPRPWSCAIAASPQPPTHATSSAGARNRTASVDHLGARDGAPGRLDQLLASGSPAGAKKLPDVPIAPRGRRTTAFESRPRLGGGRVGVGILAATECGRG